MNSECERRKLIWKHFWKRKREEVGGAIKKTWILVLGFLLLMFVSIGITYPEDSIMYLVALYIVTLVLLIVLFGMAIWILYLCIRDLIGWLRSNWELATEDADKILETRRRKGR